MNGNRALLDTNIIIFLSKGILDFKKILSDYKSFSVFIITYMEIYGYNFISENEKAIIDELFNNLEIIDVNYSIAQQVIIYRKREDKKIKIPDAIILATAKYLDADLITDDWDDFLGFDDEVKIIKPRT